MKHESIRLIKLEELKNKLSMSKSAIYRRMDRNCKLYDTSFPRPIKLGETTSRWVEREVDEWIYKQLSKKI